MRTQSYILTVFLLATSGVSQSQNLLTNPDFEVGATGFQTDYVLWTGGGSAMLEGYYWVGSNPSMVHDQYASFGDHTSGSGNMLVVNGGLEPANAVWKQTFPATTNTTYYFSAWGATAHPTEPAKLCLYVNDVQQGPTLVLPLETGIWQNLSALWPSTTNSVATLEVRLSTTQTTGNDFVLDDLSLVMANAQTNSWTGPVSGYWESPHWSLGVLPGPNQTILFTNEGWKALGIGADTVKNYPQTLSVDSITISSPPDSFNTLLLNYAGLVTPLTANSLTVGSNSAVVMDSSALRVSGKLAVGGTFTEDNFSQVTTANLDVGYNGPGIFNLNSGTLTSGGGSEYVGSSFPSQFVQQGGTNSARNLIIYAGSEYDLNDGEMASWIYVRAGGTFNLRGGTFLNSSDLGSHIDGRFFQSGGSIVSLSDDGALIFPAEDAPWGTSHQIGAVGTGLQTGGTNRAFALRVGFYNMPSAAPPASVPRGGGSYTLSNGVFVTTETMIAPSGGMQQWGGTHAINGTLSVRGAINFYLGVANQVFSAGYLLGAGTLLPHEISIGMAAGLTQSGGTNQVSDAITLSGSDYPYSQSENYPGTYRLAGGLLTASNLILNVRSEFSQTGGQLTVRNLQLNNGSFSQSGGQLVISNIQFTGGVFSQSGGAFTHSGVLALAGGTWSVPDGQTQQLGQLQVLGASTLEAGSVGSGATTILRLQDSRDVPWSGATLSIVNWNPTTGPGPDHIFVGTNAQGLTADQLNQVVFVRPDGSPWNYSAAILPTGELVPGAIHHYNYITSNGAITITGYTGAGGDVTIPDTINNLPVTAIAFGAFRFCNSLTSVTIPSSVINIGEQAFAYCPGLTNVVIGSSVTSIGSYAFLWCTSLNSITIPNSVTSIGDGAFQYCRSLTRATIGNSVINIRTSVFSDCTSLTSITIPNSVISIGDHAFYSCTGLISVTMGNSVAAIAERAFAGCSSLSGIYFQGNAPTVSMNAFENANQVIIYYLPGTMGWGPTIAGRPTALWFLPVPYTYTTDNGAITITKYTGPGGDVTIPDTINGLPVTGIDWAAFWQAALTSVRVPSSVTNIGQAAFGYCTSLTGITVNTNNAFYSSVDGVLFDKRQTSLIAYPAGKAGSYAVPDGVTHIGYDAFYGCIPTSVTIPDSVTIIDGEAFVYCFSLTNVTIGANVTSVGDSAFAGCSLLTGVYFRGNAPSVAFYTFNDANDVTIYYLPRTTGWAATFGGRPTALWVLPNTWTGSVSGYWESPNWSLGVLPGPNQTILFTNAGWKALGIGADTAKNYPQTLSVDSITISSPPDSFNTLLLNYAGFVTPLTANSLAVGSNSAVVMDASALQVAGDLAVNGTFTEIEGSQVSVGSLHLGNLGPAIFNLTNSTLSGGEEYFGGFPAVFNQQGGTNTGLLHLLSAGQYNLFGGIRDGTIQLEGGSFNFFGGSLTGCHSSVSITSGSFNLFGGSLAGYGLFVYGGNFNQFDGYLDTDYVGLTGGNFNFYGGSISGRPIELLRGGTFNFFGSSMGGVTKLYVELHGGTFNQWDGNLSPAIWFNGGNYHLAGGTLLCGGMEIPASMAYGSFLQTGGTNFTGLISLGPHGSLPNGGGDGEYSLSGGVLIASSLVLSARQGPVFSWSKGAFNQTGGFHTNGGIYINGYHSPSLSVHSSVYDLRDGLLSTPSIGLNTGAFAQSGGTNQVGTISLGNVSSFQLSGGWLTASNIYQLGGASSNVEGHGKFASFQQSGGTNLVSDTLLFGELSRNGMSGGWFTAQNLQVTGGASFLHSGGTINIPGVVTLGDGIWDEQTARGTTFGTLQLTNSSSTLLLPTNGSCILTFGDSSSRSWPTQAVLVIERWNGSPLGHGQQQIMFGNSPGGLTAQQLHQIQFHNPPNLPAGTYPARILATGEIVPDALLFAEHNGQQPVLSWSSGWTLQTTTNLAEPFVDLEIATSPYTNLFTDPQRFFRLSAARNLSGLVAYYPFDGNTDDASGNGHGGTSFNVSYTTGQTGGAGYFDGSGYVSVPHSPAIANLARDVTLSAWIKIDQEADYGVYGYLHILSKGATYLNLYADYAIGLSNPGDNLPAGSLQFENSPSGNSQNNLGSGFKISEGIWHHVAVTFASPGVSFYCDGVLVATVNSPAPLIRASTQPLYIGCRYLSPFVGGFVGAIDEVRIYNRALFASEITQLYTGPSTVAPILGQAP